MDSIYREVIEGPVVSFQVIGRAGAMRLLPSVPHIIISITEPRAPEARYPESPHRLGILRLQFHDAEVPLPDRALLTPEDARAIVEFVKRHLGEARLIVCQCEGGVSRSAGVAAALSRWLQNDDAPFFRYYQPNRHVYRTLLDATMAEK
ncbi:MAG: hypothetical protein KY468_17290 [Armatimonadetes bacterium]|nr:hypothetical protein [Armatimonadota bacterium]